MKIPENPAQRTPYIGLLAFSGLATLAAVLTLVPWEAASWPNIWGYKSLCTFTPGATVACALLAALSCIIRNRLINRDKKRPFAPVIVLVTLAALLIGSTIVWADAKARYTDASSAATPAQPQ